MGRRAAGRQLRLVAVDARHPVLRAGRPDFCDQRRPTLRPAGNTPLPRHVRRCHLLSDVSQSLDGRVYHQRHRQAGRLAGAASDGPSVIWGGRRGGGRGLPDDRSDRDG